MDAVRQVDVQITDLQLILRCHTNGPAQPELMAAQKKAALLERATGRKIVFFSVYCLNTQKIIPSPEKGALLIKI